MNTILLILTISLIDLSFKGWRDSHSEPWGVKVKDVTWRRMQREEGGDTKQEINKQADPPTGQ